ncbi:MAG: glucose-6-phosphate isomerase [Dysgonamonadaceae bacterium]|jgi:glucose-6-phosphate isomerase|nr:glucose-6-phosphate isomerase [Dysgonamonadaceae bacterium]
MKNTLNIEKSLAYFNRDNGEIDCPSTVNSQKKLCDLKNVFLDEEKRSMMNQERKVYETSCYFPVEEGLKGGLFWGTTKIFSGKVGNEYFMTRGHFHAKYDTSEFYWGIAGEGALIIADSSGNYRVEKIEPDSLHYISGGFAHRVVNTSDETLIFGACWPSEAGHDYESIQKKGFPVRIMEMNGKPVIIKAL